MAEAATSLLADVGVIEFAVSTGTAVPTLVQPACTKKPRENIELEASQGNMIFSLVFCLYLLFPFQILRGGEVGVMRRLKRYKTSSTKPTVAQPDTRPQAVQQRL